MRTTEFSGGTRFRGDDLKVLSAAHKGARSVRVYERLLAVSLVAQGQSVSAAARLTQRHPRSVRRWVERFRQSHRVEALHKGLPLRSAGFFTCPPGKSCAKPECSQIITGSEMCDKIYGYQLSRNDAVGS